MGEDGSTTLVVSEADAGERLDSWLARRLELSRTRIQKLLGDGRVSVDGANPRKSDPTEVGQRVEVRVPPPEPSPLEPEDLPLHIVWQDSDLLVVDKAAGMVVHPAPGHRTGTLVHALLHHVTDLSGIGGTLRPGIVHRLDKDTSGLLVVAKSDEAHRRLSDALRSRRVKRLYVAATWGHLPEDRVKIDAPVGRDPSRRERMAVVEGGRRAVTRVRVRERWDAADLVSVALETGRTHQIRVHMAHLGHPVVGDGTYGAGWERGLLAGHGRWPVELARRVPRQFLHAAGLVFDHPLTGERMRFRSPLPEDLARAARWAGADVVE
jgi:23S rRNA pseudouridine1911/1915/1917 synthase